MSPRFEDSVGGIYGAVQKKNQNVISLADCGTDVYTPDDARQTNLCTHKHRTSVKSDFHQATKTRIHHQEIRVTFYSWLREAQSRVTL